MTTAEHELAKAHVCPHCKSVYRAALLRCSLDGTPLQPFESDPLVGDDFADRYVIEECIGVGGMGRVYRARHRNMSRRFAIKVLFGEYAADRTMRARFSREAEAASRLDHPNVVPVLDFGETDEGLLYLVMPFVEGRTMRQVIAEDAPLDPLQVVEIASGLCRGLYHAHKIGLVHRDFKPGNVIIADRDGDMVPRILDFGIAFIDDKTAKQSRLTRSGAFIGTPACMAPEQATQDSVDHRADLYSLGVSLYELLTGRPPYDGPAMEVIHQHCLSPFPSMAKRAPDVYVPSTLEDLVRDLMAKQAAERPGDAKLVVDRLEAMTFDDTAETTAAPSTLRTTARTVGPGDGPTEVTPDEVTEAGAAAPEPEGAEAPPAVPEPEAAVSEHQPAPFAYTPGPMTPSGTGSVPQWSGRAPTNYPPGEDERALNVRTVLIGIVGILVGVLLVALVASSGGGEEAGSGDSVAVVGDADEPSTDQPSTDEPSADEVKIEAPSTDQPSTDEPSTDEVKIEAPSTDQPSTDEVKIEAPSTDEPSTDEVKIEEPSTGEVKIEEPSTRRLTRDDKRTGDGTGDKDKKVPRRPREVSVQQFLGRYKSVGAQLGTLSKLDAHRATPLNHRYKKISPQAAMRSPEVRQKAYRELGTLKRHVRHAIRKAR